MRYYAETKLPVEIELVATASYNAGSGEKTATMHKMVEPGFHSFRKAKNRDEFVRICNATEMNSARKLKLPR